MIRAQRNVFIIALALSLATIYVYWGLWNHQFIIVDDNTYVTNNPQVQSGLTLKNVKWAFTTTRAEFWHPLTWLSYMLDTDLFGVNPSGYLFTNLILHVLNCLMLFLVLNKFTGQVWQSGFVAALFALHPLHVESVAWIAERKDVLSALFWMLTMGAYAYYVERPSVRRYLIICLAYALGLMAKPMLVTLPFVLLLLDYWPLHRLQDSSSGKISILPLFRLLREKIPLFAISAAASTMAFLAQKSESSAAALSAYPMKERFANALLSYMTYIGKMIWPANLAVFYPFPDHFAIWPLAGSLLGLIAITALALWKAKRYPYFITGWLWYLGTLVPVIGLVKIGDFALADRYTYIPLVGLFIVVAWGLPALLTAWRFKKRALVLATAAALVCLTMTSRSQVRYWSDNVNLFNHTLAVTEKNFFAHFVLGHIYASQKDFDRAIAQFTEAVRIAPGKATLQKDLGRALASREKFKEAESRLDEALHIKPDFAEAHYYLGQIMIARNHPVQAIQHLAEALRLLPDSCASKMKAKKSAAPVSDAALFPHSGAKQSAQAIQQYQRLVANDSKDYGSIIKLALAYAELGQYDKAMSLLQVKETTKGAVESIIAGFDHWKLIKQ